MSQERPKPAHPQSEPPLKERTLSKKDYRLENYIYPDRFFNRGSRPLRIIESSPSVATYSNVVYTPHTLTYRYGPYNGALFDDQKRRIDDACVWRGTNDDCMSEEPLYFQQSTEDLATYDRPVLYLGQISWHYGHFLLESLARWWILAADAANVDRFLIHVSDPSLLDAPFVQACLALAGIDRRQLIYFDIATKIKEVIVPEPSFQGLSHIYTAYGKMWAELFAPADMEQANKTDQPLYISRTMLLQSNTMNLGEDKIEAYLKSKGARVIHPQNLSFTEQARLFNEHERIIGIIGSAMHNIVLSQAPKKVVYLTRRTVNENYLLIDKGFEADSVFLQAARTSAALQAMWQKALVKAKIRSKTVALGLSRVHSLDYERVIDWFEKSGYF